MTDRAARIVYEALNRNPRKFWPKTTCALVEAGVIKGAEKEKEE